jgi:hypothetical protein
VRSKIPARSPEERSATYAGFKNWGEAENPDAKEPPLISVSETLCMASCSLWEDVWILRVESAEIGVIPALSRVANWRVKRASCFCEMCLVSTGIFTSQANHYIRLLEIIEKKTIKLP